MTTTHYKSPKISKPYRLSVDYSDAKNFLIIFLTIDTIDYSVEYYSE